MGSYALWVSKFMRRMTYSITVTTYRIAIYMKSFEGEKFCGSVLKTVRVKYSVCKDRINHIRIFHGKTFAVAIKP